MTEEESQSLIHQVIPSNRTSKSPATLGPWGCNPLSVRSCLPTLAGSAYLWRHQKIAIPYSSGHSFQLSEWILELEPIEQSQSLIRQVIPSNWKHGFSGKRGRLDCNPLFMRSGFPTIRRSTNYVRRQHWVAIPYSSGHAFQLGLASCINFRLDYRCRNPLFVRSYLPTGNVITVEENQYLGSQSLIHQVMVSNWECRARRNPGWTVAIPYSSGHSFQLKKKTSWSWRRWGSFNPLFIRSFLPANQES